MITHTGHNNNKQALQMYSPGDNNTNISNSKDNVKNVHK